MASAPDPAPDLLAAFHAQYRRDLEAGISRGASDYRGLFPALGPELERELSILAGGTTGSLAGAEPPLAERTPPEQIGWYRLEQRLGSGGQGDVHAAWDQRLQRRIALKLLRVFSVDNLRRFQREALAASRLDHPAICTVYDSGYVDGRYYISMRFVPGASLAARIRTAREDDTTPRGMVPLHGACGVPETAGQGTRRSLDRLLEYFERAARALHAAHQAGVVHRDIKPGNLMVTPEGEPVLLDFGLAQDAAPPVDWSVTSSGHVLGTPAYMAPEQIDPQARERGWVVDARTDVWALAATMYECLTLERPFDASDPVSRVQRLRDSDPPDATARQRGIPRDLAVVLQKALQYDPARRYATAAALADELLRVRRFEPVAARPSGRIQRLHKWARRNPAATATMAGLLLALALALGLLQEVRGRELERQRSAAVLSLEAGRAEARRGRWRQATDLYRRALAAGLADPLEAQLLLVEAEDGMIRPAEAAAALASLTPPPQASPHFARYHLLKADIGVDRLRDPEAGLDDVRKALTHVADLAPADAAYARSLLAPSVPEAERLVAEALQHDPFHLAALRARGTLLAALARHEEFADHARSFAARYPDDPTARLQRAAVTVLQSGSPARSQDEEPDADEGGADPLWVLLPAVLELFRNVDAIASELVVQRCLEQLAQVPAARALARVGLPVDQARPGVSEAMVVARITAMLAACAQRLNLHRAPGRPGSVQQRSHPVVTRLVRRLYGLFQEILRARLSGSEDRTRLEQEVGVFLSVLPDPLFHCMRGALPEDPDLAELGAALERRSAFGMDRMVALLCTMRAAVSAASSATSRPRQDQARQVVERSLRRLVELGALPTAAYHLACALGFLAGASPQPLGALAEAWARGHPASGPAWTFRAELARRAGAFAEAAAHAQRALAVAPQDPVAKDILQRALAALAGR